MNSSPNKRKALAAYSPNVRVDAIKTPSTRNISRNKEPSFTRFDNDIVKLIQTPSTGLPSKTPSSSKSEKNERLLTASPSQRKLDFKNFANDANRTPRSGEKQSWLKDEPRRDWSMKSPSFKGYGASSFQVPSLNFVDASALYGYNLGSLPALMEEGPSVVPLSQLYEGALQSSFEAMNLGQYEGNSYLLEAASFAQSFLMTSMVGLPVWWFGQPSQKLGSRKTSRAAHRAALDF